MSRRIAGAILASSVTFLAGCSTPFHMSDAHVTSTPRPSAVEIAVLACQPVVTLGLVAPAGIQGLSPTVSYALTTALWNASPSIRAVPLWQTLNRLSDQGLAGEYAELLTGFGRTGILDRDRLKRIGAALGSRYVLQPGLAEYSQGLFDKFEFAGLKIVRTRLSTLRVWLQLWDAPAGSILWESTGEVTVAAPIVAQDATVSLDEVAQKLWTRIVQEDLIGERNRSWRCP